jgi:hypothetical protein
MRSADIDGPPYCAFCVGREDAATIADLRRITRAQLRRLGLARLVYLRSGTINGQAGYGIHAADGTAMAVVDDLCGATHIAASSGMTIVAVH